MDKQQQPQEDMTILTYKQAADLIGKHRSTIMRWADDGLIPTVRHPSGLPGVRKADFDRLYGTAQKLHAKEKQRLDAANPVASVASVASVAASKSSPLT